MGVAAIPEATANSGVIILVGGPQYRAGSHRQFTLLARSLAEAGIASLRFDFAGMGDSEGARQHFDATGDEIIAAIDHLLALQPAVSNVVLWGLCDAASSAAINAHLHDKVTGMILLNPWVHNGDYSPQVKLAHYYRPSLRKADQWRRLFTGEIRLSALREFARDSIALLGRRLAATAGKVPPLTFVHRMLDGLRLFQHDVLIVLSQADLTAREFSTLVEHDAQWQSVTSAPSVSFYTVQGADHTFSQPAWRDEVAQLTIDWVKKRSGQVGPTA